MIRGVCIVFREHSCTTLAPLQSAQVRASNREEMPHQSGSRSLEERVDGKGGIARESAGPRGSRHSQVELDYAFRRRTRRGVDGPSRVAGLCDAVPRASVRAGTCGSGILQAGPGRVDKDLVSCDAEGELLRAEVGECGEPQGSNSRGSLRSGRLRGADLQVGARVGGSRAKTGPVVCPTEGGRHSRDRGCREGA
jgi:hypothetical protein